MSLSYRADPIFNDMLVASVVERLVTRTGRRSRGGVTRPGYMGAIIRRSRGLVHGETTRLTTRGDHK